jgi:uncharacterized glyoxalase superfamily protein PhnB
VTQDHTPDLIAILRYDDAPAAMDWLERAFGLEKDLIVPGEYGTIAFAYMKFGDDFIGTGSTRPGLRHAVAVCIEDVDAHYERVKATGAEIVQQLQDEEHGRLYVARDPDGHLWSFGTTRPDKPRGCDVFPVVGFRDPPAGMRYLRDVFGFEDRLVVQGENGEIAHAELGYGYGVVMPTHSAAGGDNPWGNIDFGLAVHVADPDALYARAKAAGAEIVRDLHTADYGARGFSAKDIEGNLWDFSDYRPEGTRP